MEEPYQLCSYTLKVFVAESTAARVQLLYLEQGVERLMRLSNVLQRGGQLSQHLRRTARCGAASAVAPAGAPACAGMGPDPCQGHYKGSNIPQLTFGPAGACTCSLEVSNIGNTILWSTECGVWTSPPQRRANRWGVFEPGPLAPGRCDKSRILGCCEQGLANMFRNRNSQWSCQN